MQLLNALDDWETVKIREDCVLVDDVLGTDCEYLCRHEIHFEEVPLCVDLLLS